jgi:hypothetical protein
VRASAASFVDPTGEGSTELVEGVLLEKVQTRESRPSVRLGHERTTELLNRSVSRD